ncbi:MAG: hypothetical protein LBJ00_10985 [Planctomycetaceae bacterium]|nr:hypothetical protein [Planctomycetaceae bacterium]
MTKLSNDAPDDALDGVQDDVPKEGEHVNQAEALYQRYLREYESEEEFAFKEGYLKGYDRGIEVASTEIAQNLKALGGVSIPDIAKVTELSVSVVEEL